MNTTIRLILISFAVAAVLTTVSYVTALYFGWVAAVSYLEAFAVFTSYSCTFLCVMQSRWNYPIGAVSVAALSVMFFQAGLYSSMILNLYLFPTLIWGWFRWRADSNTRPVTTVQPVWWISYITLTAATWATLTAITSQLGAALAPADSAILALSILAQFLLDQKKIETWIFWAIVNVLAIYTYFNAGLILVAFQYIFFLANTVYGWYMWQKTIASDVGARV